MSEKEEKEIVIDLSKKIKFSDKLYVSIGSILLSGIILIVQSLCFGWSWGLLLNFLYSIRSGKIDEKPTEDKISEDNE